MSLDVTLTLRNSREVFDANITHNLTAMAAEAGIYMHCWRPDEIGIQKAGELVEPLQKAIAAMEADPARFEKHNAPNGWGKLEHFLPWLKNYAAACRKYPAAKISVDR